MNAQSFAAVVIGASAGAIDALFTILPTLPAGFPLPVMIVVHLPADKNSILAELFKPRCQLDVKEAEDKEVICGSTIYFAPPDYHLLVEKNKRLSLSSDEPVLYSRPSIDVLFESAADAYGAELLGVILTGASEDGMSGMKALIAAGGCGLVQDPKQAYATAMPQAALGACPEAHCLSLDSIATYLQEAATL